MWVGYVDANGQMKRVDADYCVSSIPLPVLSGLPKDLSQPVQAAIAASMYDGAGKIGLQFKRRFWEEDDAIYGGRSWTDQEIGQIIYPSHGFRSRKGMLVGYFLDFGRTMRERPPAERQRLATRTRRAHASAMRHRVRVGVLRLMAARAVEPRLLGIESFAA